MKLKNNIVYEYHEYHLTTFGNLYVLDQKFNIYSLKSWPHNTKL